SFYFPLNHPTHLGHFKGMKPILKERGFYIIAEKNADFATGCNLVSADCCCRRALACQPDFETRDTIIAKLARKLGSKVVILPKYHCELNPIE
ncbi:hypothetical protein BDV93DRAFT_451129, partial [Ceratobasidium sp. AG-I]